MAETAAGWPTADGRAATGASGTLFKTFLHQNLGGRCPCPPSNARETGLPYPQRSAGDLLRPGGSVHARKTRPDAISYRFATWPRFRQIHFDGVTELMSGAAARPWRKDRKSVVEGKSVSVRVEHG